MDDDGGIDPAAGAGPVPSMDGFHHVSLTVTDLARSVAWYTQVLGFSVHADIQGPSFRRTRICHPDADITITLTRHDAGSGDPFQETRTGMDHLAFLVSDVAEVEAWARRFQEHGVEHSEIKREPGDVARMFFRDPDHIQLEVMGVDP
jgi:glyoxylase I family protein